MGNKFIGPGGVVYDAGKDYRAANGTLWRVREFPDSPLVMLAEVFENGKSGGCLYSIATIKANCGELTPVDREEQR